MNTVQWRAMRQQSSGMSWARAAITIGLLAAGLWTVTASQVQAAPTLIVRQFMCLLPVIGTQPITISVVRPALDTATVGVPTPRLPITATGTFPAAARMVVSFLGAEWAEGTGTVTGEVDTSQGVVIENIPFTVPRTNIATGSGPLSVPGFATLPSKAFSRPGDGEILVTGITFHISLLTPSGGQTFLSPFNVSCTLASGQSDAVASFRILPASASALSANPTRRPITRSPSPGPTTARPHPDQTLSRSPTPPPSPAPNPPPKRSSFAPYLLWPVGIAAAGGLGGGAWRLLRRRSA